MIWLAGAQGMLGGHIRRLLEGRGEAFSASDREVDIGDRRAVAALISDRPPDAIVNCAGFADVRACESEWDLAYRVNGEGVRNLAWAAAECGAHLVHVSTDYVFDGRADSPYAEDAAPGPLNAYGRSKLAGEIFLRESPCSWTLVRTSWLFGEGGANFVSTVLGRLREGAPLRVVDDQVGTPTFAGDLARALLALMSHPPGVYHFANAGATSWYGFAREIAARAVELGLVEGAPRIEPISSAELGDPVARPPYSALCTDKVTAALGRRPRDWRDALAAHMERVAVEER